MEILEKIDTVKLLNRSTTAQEPVNLDEQVKALLTSFIEVIKQQFSSAVRATIDNPSDLVTFSPYLSYLVAGFCLSKIRIASTLDTESRELSLRIRPITSIRSAGMASTLC